MLIKDAINAFLGTYDPDKRANTIKTYKNALNSFEGHLQGLDIDPLTCSTDKLKVDVFLHFTDYLRKKINHAREENKKAEVARKEAKDQHLLDPYKGKKIKSFDMRSARVYLAAVVKFREWLEDESLFIPTTTQEQHIRRRYRNFLGKRPEDELKIEPELGQQMLEAAREMLALVEGAPYKNIKQKERETLLALRNVAICEALYDTGLRNSELCNLRVGDITIEVEMDDGKEQRFGEAKITGKGQKKRPIFFENPSILALETYWERRGWRDPDDPVIGRHDKSIGSRRLPVSTVSIESAVKQIAKHAGIAFHPHLFRHLYAIHRLEESHDLALVQDLLGHKDPRTTRIYATFTDNQLKQAVRDARRKHRNEEKKA